MELDRAFRQAAEKLGTQIVGELHRGYNNKSVSARVSSSGNPAWLKVVRFQPSSQLRTLQPKILQTYEWTDQGQIFHASLHEYVDQGAVSQFPFLLSGVSLNADWYTQLRQSLEQLQSQPAAAESPALYHAQAKIRTTFGKTLNTPHWNAVVHGDLHWANVTGLPLVILDWEYGGLGPQGFDVAFLLCLALDNRDATQQLHTHFDDWLQGPSGQWSQVYACARIIELYQKQESFAALLPKITTHGQRMAEGLANRA